MNRRVPKDEPEDGEEPDKDEEAALGWLFDPEWPLDVPKMYPTSDLEGWRATDAAKRPKSP